MQLLSHFEYEALPYRVVFGSGARKGLRSECERLGVSRVLVVTTPEQSDLGSQISDLLGDLSVTVFSNATMHTPLDVTEAAMRIAEDLQIDAVLAAGGGSTIGLGKAIARRTGLPQIVVATTYAGSEMTPIVGETTEDEKTTTRGPEIQPEVVIYDVDLTMTLPVGMTIVSGVNAIAHAVEALYAKNRNPVTSMMSVDAVRALSQALPILATSPQDLAAREMALYGSWLCGAALGATDTAFHHKLCHTLGGTLGLPHAQTHTIVLPYATAFNEADPNVAATLAPMAEVLGAPTVADGLLKLNRSIGAPLALSELGMKTEDIATVSEVAMRKPYWNPRPYNRTDVEAVLSAALSGAELPKF